MNQSMSHDELETVRAWAKETDQPYPIKSGFLTLLDEIDRRPTADQLIGLEQQRDRLLAEVKRLSAIETAAREVDRAWNSIGNQTPRAMVALSRALAGQKP